MNPGSEPVPINVTPPEWAAPSSRFGQSRRKVGAGQNVTGSDHIATRAQHPLDQLEIDVSRHVADAVCVQPDKAFNVIGGNDTCCLSTSEGAGILSDLVLAIDVQADQFELGMLDDRRQRPTPDISRRPLDDPILSVTDIPLPFLDSARPFTP